MRHSVEVRQLQGNDPGAGFLNVDPGSDSAGTGVYAHWNGGGEVRIRQCGNVIWLHSGAPEIRWHEYDLQSWRERTPGAREWLATSEGLVEVFPPAPAKEGDQE